VNDATAPTTPAREKGPVASASPITSKAGNSLGVVSPMTRRKPLTDHLNISRIWFPKAGPNAERGWSKKKRVGKRMAGKRVEKRSIANS